MKIAIASMFTALTNRSHSHNYGYIAILLEQLKNAGIPVDVLWSNEEHDWNQYDEVWLWQGLPMNGKLSINMFGGACPGNAETLRRLAQFKGRLRGIIGRVLNYHELQARDWQQMVTPKEWRHIQHNVVDQLDPIENPNNARALCLGDSHAPGVWQKFQHIDVRSGLTLHGALKLRLRFIIPEHYKAATIYFGQIDLRHHLMRREDPMKATSELVLEYAKQVTALANTGMKIEVALLHPIESEERKIPTPGCYKSKPFFGTWEERENLRQIFNSSLQCMARMQHFGVYAYPPEWQGPDGKMNQAYMERPRSVHVAPAHYRAFRS